MFGILCPDNVLNIFDMQYYNWKQMIGKRAKVQSVCEKWVDPGFYFIDAINTTEITEFSKELNSYSKHKAFFFKSVLWKPKLKSLVKGLQMECLNTTIYWLCRATIHFRLKFCLGFILHLQKTNCQVVIWI